MRDPEASARGEQRAFLARLDDGQPVDNAPVQGPVPRFTKVVALWIPRRHIIAGGVDLKAFVADVNEKISRRGFILHDGQILTKPLKISAIGDGVVVARPTEGHVTSWITVGDTAEVIWEEPSPTFETPHRAWESDQRGYFGLDSPYQMSEEPAEYSYSHLMVRLIDPYLDDDERIAGIVHGIRDKYYFYCPCHAADVVYTTRSRVICMGCGALHRVLGEPIALAPKRLLTADDWVDHFDEGGQHRDEEIDLSVVDFVDIDEAAPIWVTDQWEEARHRFIFFARSSPEEIARATRGTEADASIFLEAGFEPMDLSPPPAHQIDGASVDIGLLENAGNAFSVGCSAFLLARKRSGALIGAIPQLFRAVELLLKARLLELDPSALDDRPNNPTVIKRAVAAGIAIDESELEMVKRLRRLRNALQHGEAQFNYRSALALSKKAVVFVDKMAWREFRLWTGDLLSPDQRFELLRIDEVAQTARQVTEERVAEAIADKDSQLSNCGKCGNLTMVRPHPKTGASCLLCGHIPVIVTMDSGEV